MRKELVFLKKIDSGIYFGEKAENFWATIDVTTSLSKKIL